MKTLHLNLKRKWFDMIKSGEKTEEYREIKEYWVRRFVSFKKDIEFAALDEFITDLQNPYNSHTGVGELFEYFNAEFKQFDTVKFKNGYHGNAPSFIIELKDIQVNLGISRLGAEYNVFYFVLKLGEII